VFLDFPFDVGYSSFIFTLGVHFAFLPFLLSLCFSRWRPNSFLLLYSLRSAGPFLFLPLAAECFHLLNDQYAQFKIVPSYLLFPCCPQASVQRLFVVLTGSVLRDFLPPSSPIVGDVHWPLSQLFFKPSWGPRFPAFRS